MKNEKELQSYFSENSKKNTLIFTYDDFLKKANSGEILLDANLYKRLFLDKRKGEKLVEKLGYKFDQEEKENINNEEESSKDEDNIFDDLDDELFEDLTSSELFLEVQSQNKHKNIYDYNDNILYFQQMKEENEDRDVVLNKIILANQKLVKKLAGKYQKLVTGSILDVEDLIALGNQGLLKAIEKFDVDMGYQFSTYATWWIKQNILRGIADYKLTIRLPVHLVENLNKMHKIDRIYGDLPQNQYNLMLMENLKVDSKQLQLIKMYDHVYNKNLASLNAKVGESGDTELIEVINTVNDTYFEKSAEDKYILKRLAEEIDKILIERLTEREYMVLINRFGLKGAIPQTLEEIGKKENVTRERIRQLEVKALKKVRNRFVRENFAKYLEEF